MVHTEEKKPENTGRSLRTIAMLVGVVSFAGPAVYVHLSTVRFDSLPEEFAIYGASFGVLLLITEAAKRNTALGKLLPESLEFVALFLVTTAIMSFLVQTELQAITLVLGFGGGILGMTVLVMPLTRLLG